MAHHFKYTSTPSASRNNFSNIQSLLPYVWEFRGRVLLAMSCLVLSKLSIVGVPIALKQIVDTLNINVSGDTQVQIVLPVALLLAYGAMRLASSLFNELRDVLFTKVRYRAMRRLTIRTLEHLHELSLRYHLDRKTGAISRDLQRGAVSLSSLLNYLTFSIIPVLVEFGLVAAYLITQYDIVFTLVIFVSVTIYILFTFKVTNWRVEYRHEMNRLESKANNEAIDSLINYETVKYFNNEAMEFQRCNDTLGLWEVNAVKNQMGMSALNFGQGAIIAVGVTLIMFFAAGEVVDGDMSIGDFVLVNAFLLQLFIPLGFLGIIYRSIRYALADMDQLVKLLDENPEIVDKENAAELQVSGGEVQFDRVGFSYQTERQILHDVSFTINPGQKLAVVGSSGAGKSTLARLLFRFYDVNSGCIRIDGQDLREVTQHSVRRAIGIVPQDTVLFNESIYYNLAYANPDAGKEEIIQAAKKAHIHEFISSLPQGYDTVVGERGLKLSGGEKQRVAIARIILKAPKILVFDEATSALDSKSEQAILEDLRQTATNHTTLVIAHRLSTIVDADYIMVLEQGRIAESGTHEDLLQNDGVYAQLWRLQQKEKTVS
ncbi:MAG: ABC transporter ATP-binding protein/permease [Gammaproteobacteria bacterium]|nr:ABC transporter ATP-binding protein/permease [Gammaproteobacteria bacterium]MDH5803380.1 ABC transporter ATP-binding protein/permease [Gammaproteobacteria bacterium]